MAHDGDLLHSHSPPVSPRPSCLNSEDAQTVVPRYASCSSSQAWLPSQEDDPSQPRDIPPAMFAFPESSPSSPAANVSSFDRLNQPARHLSNNYSFASTATSCASDDNLGSGDTFSHLLPGTSISLSHLTLTTLDLANQASTSRTPSLSAALHAPTPSSASSTPTSDQDTGSTGFRGPSFDLAIPGVSDGLAGGIAPGGVYASDPVYPSDADQAVSPFLFYAGGQRLDGLPSNGDMATHRADADQAVSPFLFHAGGQRLDGPPPNGDVPTHRATPPIGEQQGCTAGGGQVMPSPFAKVDAFDFGPEYVDSNVKVLEAKPVLNTLSSRPSFPIQELGSTNSKKLPSLAMKVGKERFFVNHFHLNALLLCRQPAPETNLFVLLAKNKELMVHDVQEKASRTQVLSSEVRAVAHRSDVTWVGMTNGVLEVETKGMKRRLDPCFQCAVSSIALDDDGIAWVGSEHGELRVLELRVLQNSSGTHGVLELREHTILQADGARARGIRLEDTRVKGSMHHSSASNKITAMCSVGHHMVLAKGEGDSANIQLWKNQQDHRQLEDINLCGQDEYKACTYITSIPWRRLSHRILTGHSRGAVLLWNKHDEGKLSPAMMIDVPAGMQPIRGLVHIPAVNSLCVGAGKHLHFVLLPTPKILADLPQNRSWWQVKPLTITAHRASVKMMAGTINGHVITVSGWGKMRLWYEDDICKALRQANIVGPDTSVSMRPSLDRQSGQIICYKELKFKERVGHGSYGTVYEAEWNGMKVAVKTLHHFNPHQEGQSARVYEPKLQQFTGADNAGHSGLPAAGGCMGSVPEQMRELHREMQNLQGLGHENVVRLFGLVSDHASGPMIVTEFCKSNVSQIIQEAREGRVLKWWRRTRVLLDVARGMLYLHSRPNPVVHGDLRSPNLLLDNEDVAKIADFGSARAMLANINSVELSKTCNPRWAAPEKLQDNKDGLAADVWAYGIVMYELATMRRPYYNIDHDYAVYEEVKKGIKPAIPADLDLSQVPAGYMDLMNRCLKTSPLERPQFEAIYETMKSIKSTT